MLQRLLERITWQWGLGALLLVGALLWAFNKSQTEAPAAQAEKIYPQSYITRVEVYEYDAQGLRQYHLQSPLITQFQVGEEASDEDYALLVSPKMHFSNTGDEAPWDASAEMGRSSNGQLLLQTNVVITQMSPSQGLLQLETSELHVRPAEQYAETDKAVKMHSTKGQIDAVGMNAYLRESRVHLQSDVRAVYEPR